MPVIPGILTSSTTTSIAFFSRIDRHSSRRPPARKTEPLFASRLARVWRKSSSSSTSRRRKLPDGLSQAEKCSIEYWSEWLVGVQVRDKWLNFRKLTLMYASHILHGSTHPKHFPATRITPVPIFSTRQRPPELKRPAKWGWQQAPALVRSDDLKYR